MPDCMHLRSRVEAGRPERPYTVANPPHQSLQLSRPGIRRRRADSQAAGPVARDPEPDAGLCSRVRRRVIVLGHRGSSEHDVILLVVLLSHLGQS